MMNIPKPLVVGAPRSGFSLLISVCSTILHLMKVDAHRTLMDIIIHVLVQLSSHYIKDQYDEVFRALGLERDVVFNGEFHLLVGGPKWLSKESPDKICVRKYIGIKGKGDFLLITSHPREVLEYYLVLHSHENPRLWLETPYYNHFIRMASVRNPIGIINSASFSLNAMASEYIQRFMPNEDEDTIRQRHGAYKLTDMDFVRGLITYLKSYLDEFIEVKDRYFIMKWENLINSPVETIKSIGQAMGVRISDDNAMAIWKSMDHKNLLRYHKHNYRRGKGIVGDWKNSLVNEHMELFRECDFDRYLGELGYPSVPELNPGDYSPYQKLVARYIQRGEVFRDTGDPDLFGLAFNKSNIDASKFNFKSFPKKKWTHVERSTIGDDAIVEAISGAVENACERVNEILLSGINADLRDKATIHNSLRSLERKCRVLMSDCRNQEGLDLHNQIFSALSGLLN